MNAMNVTEVIEKTILKYPICEFYFGKTNELVFSEKVRAICKYECESFANSWVCPPYCGSVRDNIDKCRTYQRFCLFSTVSVAENAGDKYEYLRIKKTHEKITSAIRDELSAVIPDAYFLSAGCMLCEKCLCPSKPCPHPKERIFPIESHCIVVMQTIRDAGMTDYFGDDSTVYFSMILYNNNLPDEGIISYEGQNK